MSVDRIPHDIRLSGGLWHCLSIAKDKEKTGDKDNVDLEMEMNMLSLAQMSGTTAETCSDRSFIGRVWDAVIQSRQRAESRAAVASLLDQDDRMLRDIGVTREDGAMGETGVRAV